MLRRLDARISAILGVCWYEESFDVEAKIRELKSIQNKYSPNLAELTNICRIFFAGDSECFSPGPEENIIIHKIPPKYNAVECTIEPFYIESKLSKEQPDARSAGIYYKNAANEWKSKFCATTGEMVLLLCQDFITDSDQKKLLLNELSSYFSFDSDKEKEKEIQRKLQLLKREEALINELITDNANFQSWLRDFVAAQPRYRDLWPCRNVIVKAIRETLS